MGSKALIIVLVPLDFLMQIITIIAFIVCFVKLYRLELRRLRLLI